MHDLLAKAATEIKADPTAEASTEAAEDARMVQQARDAHNALG